MKEAPPQISTRFSKLSDDAIRRFSDLLYQVIAAARYRRISGLTEKLIAILLQTALLNSGLSEAKINFEADLDQGSSKSFNRRALPLRREIRSALPYLCRTGLPMALLRISNRRKIDLLLSFPGQRDASAYAFMLSAIQFEARVKS